MRDSELENKFWNWIRGFLLVGGALVLSGYVAGSLKNHNHTSAAGDGGQLSNLRTTGVDSHGTDPIQVTSMTATGQLVFGTGVTNAITFPDSTIQTTAGVASGNAAILANANTFTNSGAGANTFNTGVTIGDTGQVNPPEMFISAKSIDGAAETGPCVGVLQMSGSGGGGFVVWTSTTAGAQPQKAAVLISGTCNPGSVCQFQTMGAAQIPFDAGAPALGNLWAITTTRCKGQALGAANAGKEGYVMSAGAGNTTQWVWINE